MPIQQIPSTQPLMEFVGGDGIKQTLAPRVSLSQNGGFKIQVSWNVINITEEKASDGKTTVE